MLDNSLTAHGKTLESMTANLDAHWKVTRVRSPWLKHTVEGLFDVLNDSLLSGAPGYILSDQIDRVDYDPAKSGCLGFRVFLAIFLKWLLDIYQVSPHSTSRLPPLVRWRNGIINSPPGFPDSAADLDLIFGILREGNVNRRLDHNGLVFENLYYYGKEIEEMRRRNGDVQHCPVKVNPNDLGKIRAYDAKADMWVHGVAMDSAYATGKSLHLHQLIQKRAREHHGGVDTERLLYAESELSRMITNAPALMENIRSNARLAASDGHGNPEPLRRRRHDRRQDLERTFCGHAARSVRQRRTPPFPPAAIKPQSCPWCR